jgi:hypothetical protein
MKLERVMQDIGEWEHNKHNKWPHRAATVHSLTLGSRILKGHGASFCCSVNKHKNKGNCVQYQKLHQVESCEEFG